MCGGVVWSKIFPVYAESGDIDVKITKERANAATASNHQKSGKNKWVERH
jgi:hypothetical protein